MRPDSSRRGAKDVGRGLRVGFPVTVLVGILAACLVSGSAGAARATATRAMTIYSVATNVQYLNNADDEARGSNNNPFDAATNKLKPKLTWKGNGPFAGDITVFSFKLYDSPKLTKLMGTASYTCYYNYDRRALCDADFIVTRGGSGTIVASGPVNFDDTRYTLVVTGGTGRFLGARGELSETPVAAKSAQRLGIDLVAG